MSKNWIAFGFLFGFVGLVMFSTGCGQQAAETATTTTVSSVTTTTAATVQKVTISGSVTASQSDLAQLGVTTLAVDGKDDTAYLKSLGVTDAQLYGIVKPMAVAAATATLQTVNDDGSFTDTSHTGTVSNGVFSIEILASAYDATKQYAVKCSRTSSDTGKTLEMRALVGTVSDNRASVAINSKADLVAKTIVNQVIKVLKSAKIDKAVIDQVKDVIVSTVNSMVEAGTISIPTMVRESTATENQAANATADVLAESGQAKFAVDAVKYKAGFSKATTTDEAKGVIREIFTSLFGDPRGMPEEVITSLATQLLADARKTVSAVATALDGSLANASGQPVTGNVTATGLSSTLTEKLATLYGIIENPTSGALDARLSVYLAVFPKETWKGITITGDTSLNIPQIILVVEASFHIAQANNLMFNPALAMNTLFPGMFEDKLSVMHAEMRIVSYFNPASPEAGSQPALESFLQVGNILKEFDAAQVAGVTATLTYPKAAGATATVNYQAVSRMGGGAGAESVRALEEEMKKGVEPLGMKQFTITPYSWGGVTPEVITDFAAGNATIKVYKDGTLVASKTAAIIDTTNFFKIQVAFKVPKQTYDESRAESFPVGSAPVLSWVPTSTTGGNVADLIPSGYRLAYALMIFQKGTYGTPFFQSWERQEFIEGTSFPLASTGKTLTAGTYDVDLATLLLEEKGRFPVAEGGRSHSVFKVASSADVQTQTGAITLDGTVTPAAGQDTTKIRVGLFHAETWTSPLTPVVSAVSLGSNNTYQITVTLADFAKNGRYEVRAWIDDGDGKISDPMSGGTEFFAPCFNKDIFKEAMGVTVFNKQTGQGSTLKESSTGFDITMMSGWEAPPTPNP